MPSLYITLLLISTAIPIVIILTCLTVLLSYCLLRVFKIQKTLRAAPFSLLLALLTAQSICNYFP